jgi:hypothetical protein
MSVPEDPVLPDVGHFTFLRKNNLSQNETSAILLIHSDPSKSAKYIDIAESWNAET